MAKNGNAPDPFEILNSELNESFETSSSVGSNGKPSDYTQIDNAKRILDDTVDKSPDARHTGENAEEKKAANSPKGNGCVEHVAKIALIIFLAVMIAWIIFMPRGSLSELKDHISKNVFGTITSDSSQINQDILVESSVEKNTTVTDSVSSVQSTSPKTTTRSITTTATAVATSVKTTSKTKSTPTNTQNSRDTDSDSKPYYIYVYLKSQIVAIYDTDDDLHIAFTCSSGKASTPTRTGDYNIINKYRWRLMIGNCYTQYASSFSSGYLFHSIPYNRRNAATMSNASYDKLGSPASAGCIRLCFRDSKWIYDNCPTGTFVKVVNSYAPKGIVTETIVPRINDSAHKGWDPTDTDENNPYNN